MKKVLVYGDSNTWGDNSITRSRSNSWVDILNSKMQDYNFIGEGLPGRVAGTCNLEKPYKNGKETFLSTFLSSAPVDLVLIALGTNDLQEKYNRSSEDIYNDLIWYEEVIKEMLADIDNHDRYFYKDEMPKFIYILPTNFDYIDNNFNEQGEIKRKEIIKYFNNSDKTFIEVNNISLVDGLHYSKEGHMMMAKLVEDMLIRE